MVKHYSTEQRKQFLQSGRTVVRVTALCAVNSNPVQYISRRFYSRQTGLIYRWKCQYVYVSMWAVYSRCHRPRSLHITLMLMTVVLGTSPEEKHVGVRPSVKHRTNISMTRTGNVKRLRVSTVVLSVCRRPDLREEEVFFITVIRTTRTFSSTERSVLFVVKTTPWPWGPIGTFRHKDANLKR